LKRHSRLLAKVGAIEIPILRRRRGIYFLLKSGEVVYIGKTEDVTRRLGDHINVKNFDQAFFAPVDSGDLSLFELAMIRIFQPALNAPRDKLRSSPDDFALASGLLPPFAMPSVLKSFADAERRLKNLPKRAPDAMLSYGSLSSFKEGQMQTN
jgi:hypothetical protein